MSQIRTRFVPCSQDVLLGVIGATLGCGLGFQQIAERVLKVPLEVVLALRLRDRLPELSEVPLNEQAMATYCGLMAEVKYRVEGIDAVLAGSISMRARMAEEFCYLQLRQICEIVALGCLVIHGDVSATKKDLLRSYKADWIINTLGKMHPKFYPTPLEHVDVPDADGIPSWVHRRSGFLAKRELLDLVHQAGDKLHRGSLRNLMKREVPNFAAIKAWRDKIIALLNRHIVISPNEQTLCYFIMDNGKGEVASNLFVATRPIAQG